MGAAGRQRSLRRCAEAAGALKALVFPSMLIVLILGSIFFGVATPTESAAVGVAGAMMPALIKGKPGQIPAHAARNRVWTRSRPRR
jgi:TRAP-type mannitol/chloroaromatic compound transport system permease large subunit